MSGVTEVIFDMSFALGNEWTRIAPAYREALMDRLGGSRGLYDWIHTQATAFEAMWVALDEEDDRREDYYGEVNTWFHRACDELILEAINYV